MPYKHSGNNNRYRLRDELREVCYNYELANYGKEAASRFKNEKDSFTGIDQASQDLNVNNKNLKHLWLKTPTTSGFITNPNYQKEFDFEEVFERIATKCFTTNRKPFKIINKQYDRACEAVLSDQHIGMNPNPNGKGLFGFDYNTKIHTAKVQEVFNTICNSAKLYGVFDKLIIADLGDQQDGYEGKTTRGGHELEQNITTAGVFEHCIVIMIRFIENLVRAGICKKIVYQTVVNSNHSGTFSHLVAIAVKQIIQRMYDTDLVEIDILEKFLEHRYYGDHAHVLSHGKDDKYMKHGLPRFLNAKAIDLLTDYIRHNDIDRNAKYIHVKKGDLHVITHDDTNNLFDYRNYGSFAPPSAWIQTNYGISKSSYAIQVLEKKSSDIYHKNCYLNYKRV